jgi:hypothetical protein
VSKDKLQELSDEAHRLGIADDGNPPPVAAISEEETNLYYLLYNHFKVDGYLLEEGQQRALLTLTGKLIKRIRAGVMKAPNISASTMAGVKENIELTSRLGHAEITIHGLKRKLKDLERERDGWAQMYQELVRHVSSLEASRPPTPIIVRDDSAGLNSTASDVTGEKAE